MDSHCLLAENDDEIDNLLLHENNSCFSRFGDSCRQLCIPTSLSRALRSQQQLFKTFVASPVQHKRFSLADGGTLNFVDIAGADSEYRSNHRMDAMGGGTSTASVTDAGKPTLLLMHGYGSGLAMFFDNYDKFAQQFVRVLAVDWRGMGASSRDRSVPRPPSCCCCACDCDVFDEASSVDYFVDSLHELVQGLGLSNLVLAGHSLGGYLCAKYLMKYYGTHEGVVKRGTEAVVKGLILFSPAGLEPMPVEVVPPSQVSFKAALATTMAKSNCTPQGVLRAFGCFGRERVHMLVARRFGSDRWSTEEAEIISDYLYHISALPRAGEDALNALLQLVFTTVPGPDGPFHRPKVISRRPLTPAELAKCLAPSHGNVSSTSCTSATSVSSGIPLLLMYGDLDWLGFPGARKFVDALKNDFQVDASYAVVRNAGHHLYMDNTGHFHSAVDSWLQKYFPVTAPGKSGR